MKDVLINITGSQNADGDHEVIEMTTKGQMEKQGKVVTLSYPETEMTGMPGVTTTVTVDGDMVTLNRMGKDAGDYQSRMMIELGRRHLCHYDTGMGDMMIGVFGERLRSNFADVGGELFMRYTIDVNGGYQSRNEIKITVKEQ